MAIKRERVIGTTLGSIAIAEEQLGRKLPPSFRDWLLKNNGLAVKDVRIFPVLNERDIRKTWDSIVRQYDDSKWFPEYFEDEGLNAKHLLPFASLDSGDYYCFDYSRKREDEEVPVVWWSHETAEIQNRSESFAEFVYLIELGDL